jgi:tetratricopeptide (TPR) repeat protein
MIDTRKAHELEVVELNEDIPEFGVYRGERGTVVEALDTPREAYVVEFFDARSCTSKLAYGVRPDQIQNVEAVAKEHYQKGMIALNDGRFLEALAHLRKAVSIIPAYIRALHNSLAESIGPNKDWQKFIFAMHLVRFVDPNYEMAKTNLAIAYLNWGVEEARKGGYEYSLRIFQVALTVEVPTDLGQLIKDNIAASYTAMATSAYEKMEMEKVLSMFATAHFIASTDSTRSNLAKAHFHYANFCVEEGKLSEAIDSYERAEDGGLLYAEVLNNHARTLAMSGRVEDAIMLFEAAHSLAPEDETIASNLSAIRAFTAAVHQPWRNLIAHTMAAEFSTPPTASKPVSFVAA